MTELGQSLRNLFDEAFTAFIDEERTNIQNGTAERNLCGRLAIQVQALAHKKGFAGYYADIEYNRNFDGKVKTIINGDMRVVPITCDLILHSRGEIPAKDNLIAVEMKRLEHSEAEKEKDRDRLIALTKTSYDNVWSYDGKALPEHVCGYEIGYFVELDVRRRNFQLEEYVRGVVVNKIERAF